MLGDTLRSTCNWTGTRSIVVPLLFFWIASNSQAWTTTTVLVPRARILVPDSCSDHCHYHQPRTAPRHCWTSATRGWSLGSSSSSSSSVDSMDATTDERDVQIQTVLQLARQFGPVGSRQSPADQQRVLEAALALRPLSDPAPARIPLTGSMHHLVYSASQGGSSGQLWGPIIGHVTQEFVDDAVFINAVQLGPLKIALTARREMKSDTVLTVQFLTTRVYLWNQPIVEKDVGGGGVWNMIFAGTVRDTDGREKLVRVLETPSLFIIEQPLN